MNLHLWIQFGRLCLRTRKINTELHRLRWKSMDNYHRLRFSFSEEKLTLCRLGFHLTTIGWPDMCRQKITEQISTWFKRNWIESWCKWKEFSQLVNAEFVFFSLSLSRSWWSVYFKRMIFKMKSSELNERVLLVCWFEISLSQRIIPSVGEKKKTEFRVLSEKINIHLKDAK